MISFKNKSKVLSLTFLSKQNKALANIIYLSLDKVIRLGLGLIVFTLMARHYGPANFGLLNYSLGIVYILSAISTLGMQGVIVRDLVDKSNVGVIIGTSFGIRFFSALVLYPCSIFLIIILRPDDYQALYITAVLSTLLFFNISDVFKYWFESEVLSKYVVIIENSIFLIVSFLKMLLIYYLASFNFYILTFALEAFIGLLIIFFIFKKINKNIILSFEYKEVKNLIKESSPLIISTAAWVVYTRIDAVMIGNMLGDNYVGYYSAATKISDIVNFIPMIIISSFMPLIQRLKDNEPETYLNKFQNLYDYTVAIIILVAIIVFSLSEFIIYSLYGEDYIASVSVLKMHIWIVLINSLAMIGGKYLLLNGMQKITMYRHLFGLIINIPLNLMLIPLYGINGAAAATIISLFLTNYALDCIFIETRLIFYQKTRALFFFWIFKYAKKSVKFNK